MEIPPIKTAAEHAAALQEIDGLMCAELGTPEGDRLDALATLVEAYESKQFPMDMSNPIDVIQLATMPVGRSSAGRRPQRR